MKVYWSVVVLPTTVPIAVQPGGTGDLPDIDPADCPEPLSAPTLMSVIVRPPERHADGLKSQHDIGPARQTVHMQSESETQ